jgi:hypothetical protein
MILRLFPQFDWFLYAFNCMHSNKNLRKNFNVTSILNYSVDQIDMTKLVPRKMSETTNIHLNNLFGTGML